MYRSLGCWLIGIAFLAFSKPAVGQDWKTEYDQAVTSYQAQNYKEALAAALKAYNSSKQLDVKNQVYSLQLITVICLDGNDPDEGLKWIAEEANLFLKTEGPKSKTYPEALRKHSLLLQQKGQAKEATAKCAEALAALEASEGKETAGYASLQAYYGQLLTLTGDLPNAKAILDQSLERLVKFPDEEETYLSALSLSAQVDDKMNQAASAEGKFKKLVTLLEQNQLTNLPEYNEAKVRLAEIALAKGQTAESEKMLAGAAVGAEQKAQQLLRIAIEYQNNQQLEKANETYVQAAAAAAEASLSNNTAFSIYLNYARTLVELNLPERAWAELIKADQLAKKLFPPNSTEHAFVQFTQGDLAVRQGRTREAIAYFQRAAQNSAAMAPALRLHMLTTAARHLLNQNQAEPAVMLLQPVVAEGNVSNHDVMDATLTYCEALIASNQNDQAISVLSKSVVAASSIETKNRYEMVLADALQSKGEWRRSLQILQAIDLTPTLPDDLRASNSFRMARLHQQLGNYTEAEKSYRGAIQTYKQLQPGKPDELLLVYNSLAILFLQLGNYAEAERLYVELLRQTDTFSGYYTTLQQNLAGVYQETLRYDEAQKLLESVVEQDKTRLGERHPDYAVSLQNLAAVYQKTNQLEKANRLYNQALQIDKESGGDNTLAYATKAANLGVVYQEMGNLNEAQRLLEQALKIREVKLGKDHPDYVFNEYNLAVLHQQKGEWQQAAPLFKHVSGFYLGQIRELFPAMSEKEKTAFFNKINEVILAYQDFAVENASKQNDLPGDLLNFRLATKALLLNASTKVRNRILSSGDVVLLQRFAEWLQTKEELGKLYTLNAEEKNLNKARIQSLQQKANDLEKQLSTQSELFARDNQSEAIDWQKLKTRLAPDEAAIEMIRLRLNLKNDSIIYAALVLKPTSTQPELVIFPDGRKMEGREFSFYRNSIQFQTDNPRSYQVYWKPLEKSLQGVKTIYFSADGVYNKVNVMTLLNTATNQYLVEQFTVKLLSNLRELAQTGRSATTIQTASLFGYPDYRLGSTMSPTDLSAEATRNINPTARAIVSDGIPELPGTKEEVSKISDLLKANKWAASLYTGAEASEAAIKSQQNTGVLHIATHGFFIEGTETGQPIVLSQELAQAENNPLLRSGLILSGAEKYLLQPDNKRAEDGILTAYEAINLNLDRTDLVILSACETGAGEIKNGEGVYGLQRAFLLAGTNNLMMSLWKVDDEATQELMVEFYSQWNKLKDKSQAFRNTQLELKKKYNSPYYWGSFIMIGANP